MNNITIFKQEDSFREDTIVYGIIDRIDYADNDWSKTLSKNIADYTIQDLTVSGYEVVVSNDEESILQYLSTKNFKFVVMISTGTDFVFDPNNDPKSIFNQNGDTFVNHAKKFCQNKDFFIAGHILDRNEDYYELHHQCYILNLEIYKQFNCPKIGKSEYSVFHEQIEPIRSEISYHHNHTPVFIKPGNVIKKYKNKRHGWNIISFALKNNLKIEIFDQELRTGKKHYYPEHENTFTKEINFVYDRYEFCSSSAISPFNSETFFSENFIGPIEQLIVPASGLNWINYLAFYKFQKNTVIKFYDYSLSALEFMNNLIHWDGKDYPKFVESFLDKKINFLSNKEKILICGPKDLNTAWKNFNDNLECNFEDLWQTIINNVNFEFHHRNLLNFNQSTEWIEPNKKTIINLSNIFNYVGTAPFYSVKFRLRSESEFLKKVREINKDTYIMFSQRASSGFSNQPNYIFSKVSDIPIVEIEQLKKPSWHQNKDWSESLS